MKHRAILLVPVGVAVLLGIGYLVIFDSQLRGGALETALLPIIEKNDPDASPVALAILQNHRETRQIAALWSGLYWGFAWTSAIFSALAGVILKLESILPDEKMKKDIAALLTVCAALMVTISTSGDFQRKWQANRTASAEIERTGYAFLEHKGADARSYLAEVGASLEKRHFAILGGGDKRKELAGQAKP